MKKSTTNAFNDFLQRQSTENIQLIKEFFADFNTHCLISKAETKKIRDDFEKAILYYAKIGVSLSKAQWEEAKMSPKARQEKMQQDREKQIADANERKAAAEERIKNAKEKN